ncbi:MAG: histidine phosphatase family protein, partial [Muribaculaceae bacterium]|nr:histidine phosphatase family protein [Muribaculaceae bacterium]
DERLYEMNFGEWEMQRYDDIKDPRLQQWFDDWQHVAPPGGESFLDQQRRVASFIEEMRCRYSSDIEGSSSDISCDHNILVFTHAGVMMNAMLLCGLVTLDNVFSIQPTYGTLLEITL